MVIFTASPPIVASLSPDSPSSFPPIFDRGRVSMQFENAALEATMAFSKFQTLHELPVPFEAKLQFFPNTSFSKCGCTDSRLRLRVEGRMFFPSSESFPLRSPVVRRRDGRTDRQQHFLSHPFLLDFLPSRQQAARRRARAHFLRERKLRKRSFIC